MTEANIVVLALLVLGWALVSASLARANVTGPLVFTVVGCLIGNPDWGPLPVNVDASSVHAIAEITLALVLFSDASRVNVGALRRDTGPPLRLLGIGLPLTILLGGLTAAVLFGDLPWALAGFVGAALAPTDAALSAQVINDRTIPLRLRRALNVESGLNDGIVTPIVTSLLLLAATQLGFDSDSESGQISSALRELGGGIGVGLLMGFAGAWAVRHASERGFMAPGARRLAVLAIAVGSYTLAVYLEFNGFIAAFIAGITFGTVFVKGEARADEDLEKVGELPELGGQVLALVVWFLFGATLLPVAFNQFGWTVLLFAVLSLTLVRMVPVAIAMIRSGFDRPTTIFLGWFGPRGLASVVFALLAIEKLGETSPEVGQAVAAVTLTVLGSVVLHGITAGPGGRRYVQLEDSSDAPTEAPAPRTAGFMTRGSSSDPVQHDRAAPGADQS